MANYHDIRYNMTLSSSTTGGGAMTLLETQTASSSSTISFTSNIDSTYKEYVFRFYDIHPSTNDAYFLFNGSSDSGSNYNVTKTSTFFHAYHDEADNTPALGYDTNSDLAQSTDFQIIHQQVGNGNDNCSAGFLHLFNPSSTTYVKHFLIRSNRVSSSNYSVDTYIAGYFNTTSAIDAVQFKMNSGNIDAGTIKMYGIK